MTPTAKRQGENSLGGNAGDKTEKTVTLAEKEAGGKNASLRSGTSGGSSSPATLENLLHQRKMNGYHPLRNISAKMLGWGGNQVCASWYATEPVA